MTRTSGSLFMTSQRIAGKEAAQFAFDQKENRSGDDGCNLNGARISSRLMAAFLKPIVGFHVIAIVPNCFLFPQENEIGSIFVSPSSPASLNI